MTKEDANRPTTETKRQLRIEKVVCGHRILTDCWRREPRREEQRCLLNRKVPHNNILLRAPLVSFISSFCISKVVVFVVALRPNFHRRWPSNLIISVHFKAGPFYLASNYSFDSLLPRRWTGLPILTGHCVIHTVGTIQYLLLRCPLF